MSAPDLLFNSETSEIINLIKISRRIKRQAKSNGIIKSSKKEKLVFPDFIEYGSAIEKKAVHNGKKDLKRESILPLIRIKKTSPVKTSGTRVFFIIMVKNIFKIEYSK